MKLTHLLSEKRPDILKRWFDVVVESYPADTTTFLRKQKDRFANPVGYTLKQGTEAFFDELLGGADAEKAAPFLDGIIRIRAVQEGLPSRAIVFILLLKGIVREILGEAVQERSLAEELAALESRIDAIALLAFDSFMKCREKIYEVKTNETRNMSYRLLQKAQMLSYPKKSDDPAETPQTPQNVSDISGTPTGGIPGEEPEPEGPKENRNNKPKPKEVAK